jgi:hypothetical protein
MTRLHAALVGFVLGAVMATAGSVSRRVPDIAVAWGNAWKAHELRLAEDAPRQAAAAREEAERIAANAAYNEANCKVTVDRGFGGREVITGVRSIHPTTTSSFYCLRFGGGVERCWTVIKTENCR